MINLRPLNPWISARYFESFTKNTRRDDINSIILDRAILKQKIEDKTSIREIEEVDNDYSYGLAVKLTPFDRKNRKFDVPRIIYNMFDFFLDFNLRASRFSAQIACDDSGTIIEPIGDITPANQNLLVIKKYSVLAAEQRFNLKESRNVFIIEIAKSYANAQELLLRVMELEISFKFQPGYTLACILFYDGIGRESLILRNRDREQVIFNALGEEYSFLSEGVGHALETLESFQTQKIA